MNSGIEMDVQSKHTIPPATSSEQILQRTTSKQDADASIEVNGPPRSNLRMFAILTALFVCQTVHPEIKAYIDSFLSL